MGNLLHSFKVKNYFSNKDHVPDNSKCFLVYKFTSASCSSSYIGETCHHFKSSIEEHFKKDVNSHNFKDLHPTTTFFDSYNSLFLKIVDKGNSKFDFKEALHISWRKPNLNAQQNLLALQLSLQLASPLCSFVFLFFVFLFHLLFSLSLTLIITIIYRLNYSLLLLHLITTHLVSHLSLSSIIFIISYTNYRHLLLS